MIAKQYRLTERELGKVLSRRKPFFSYMFVANILPNRIGRHRLGILLSGKVAKGSVNRNFWRRRFYDLAYSLLIQNTRDHSPLSSQPSKNPTLQKSNPPTFDMVFVPKKGTILDHKNQEHLAEFEKNIQFLCRTILKNS